MGYYSTIEIEQSKTIKISFEEFKKLLTEEELKFLEEWYDDMTFENGNIELNEYYRKNYEQEIFFEVMKKLCRADKNTIIFRFCGEDTEMWGYKITPNKSFEIITKEEFVERIE